MTETREPLPPFLAARIKRQAFWAGASWAPYLSIVFAFLIAVNGLWATGNVESVFVPIFWNLVLAAAAWFFGRELRDEAETCFHPDLSAEAQYLRSLGSLSDIACQVEAELQAPDLAYGKEAVFTRNWLVLSGGGRSALRRLDDLVWVFPKATTTRLNFVLPIWRSHSVVFRFAKGAEAEAKCDKDWSVKLVEHASKRVPGIVAGYDEGLDKIWGTQREEFVAEILKRKQQGRP